MPKLVLNNSDIPYKEFPGSIHKEMPKLIEEGRTPITIAEVMERRLELFNIKFPNAAERFIMWSWYDNYITTGDGIFYHPNGNFKVVLNAQPLRELNPNSNFFKNKLLLGEDKYSSIDIYNSLNGPEFNRNNLKLNSHLTEDEVINHPIWRALVEDKNLLKEYANATFRLGKEKNKNNYDIMMGIYISTPLKNNVTGNSWVINYVAGYKSSIKGNFILKDSVGNLIGVAPVGLNMKNEKILKPEDIADNVFKYFNTERNLENITKEGILKAVQEVYK